MVQKYGRKIQLFDDIDELFNYKNSTLEINKDGKACLLIGMRLSSSFNCLSNSNFVSLLYDNNIIKDATWTIKFNNENENSKYDGEFILGSLPNEYNQNQLHISNVLNYKYYQDWELQFKSIYFYREENKENIIKVDTNINIEFDIDIKVILGSRNYYKYINEYFFTKNKDQCKYDLYDKKYKIIIC